MAVARYRGHRRAAAAGALWLMAALLPAGLRTLEAQGEGPAPFLEATMLTARVRFETEPWARTRMSLLDGASILSEITAEADADGILEVEFPATDGPEPVIRPGLRLSAVPDAGEAVTVTVPPLSVRLDEPGRRLVGAAPPGASLAGVVRNVAGDEEAIAAVVDAAGRYTISLPASMRNASGLNGAVTMAAPSWALHAAFRELRARLEVGGASVSGSATLGREIKVAARGAGGANGVSTATTVLRSPDFATTVTTQGAPRPVVPGDLVLVYEDGTQRLGGIVPDLTVEATAAGLVSGTSLAGTRVRIEAAGPSGVHASETMADEVGAFHADLSDVALMLPGTRVTAAAGSRLAFQATSLVAGIDVPVHRPYVAGVVAPSATIRLAIQDADGSFQASAETTAGADGRFQADLRDRSDQPARLQPGSTMILGVGNAVFRRYTLPDMAAVAEPGEDFVAGHGPPAQPILVSVSAADGAMVTAVPDELGLLVADFGRDEGRFDIMPGTIGSLAVRRPGQVVIRTPWAAPRLSVTLGNGAASGTGFPGQAAGVDLAAGEAVLATGAGTARDDDGAFALSLAAPEAEGQPLPVAAGDRLRLALPGWTQSTVVPELTIAADPVGNAVHGTAVAGKEVAISLSRGGRSAVWRTVPGASGRYTVTLAPRWTLIPGDLVSAATYVNAVAQVHATARAVDLELDMPGGSLSGFGVPGGAITASLLRSGSPVATASGEVAMDGTYAIVLRDETGSPGVARGGDSLIIATAGQSRTIAVADFTVQMDSADDTISGTAPESTVPQVKIRQATGPLAGRWIGVPTSAAAGGRYEARPPAPGVQAGTEAAVSLDWRGHRFLLRARAPFLDVQRGGGTVAGLARPGETVALSVARGGTVLTATTLTATADGSFETDVSRGSPPLRLLPGDAVDLGGPGITAATTVAALTAALSAPDRVLAGHGPPNSDVYIRVANGPDAAPVGGTVASTDDAGAFAMVLPGNGPLAAGTAAEAGVLDADGHRTHVLEVVPYIRARIGASEISGRAAPLAAMALLVGGAGSEARGRIQVDTQGRWWGEAFDEGGTPVEVQPLAVIALSGGGRRDVELTVPVLSAGFAPKGALAGMAPPRQVVTVDLEAAGARRLTVVTRADVDGRWSVGEADLPPGAPFPLRQAQSAVVWVLVGPGHRVEAVAHRGQATPTPFMTNTPPVSPTPPPTSTPSATSTATATDAVIPTPTASPRSHAIFVPRASTMRR